MELPAERVVSALRSRGATAAVAESLTGGLVCAAITDVPGASTVLSGGVVAYTPEAKVEVVGVPAEVVARHGVVSRECALAMAEGVRRLLGADWGAATTGVAGPGPSDGHEAGTVHVAVAGESLARHRALHLHGDRSAVRAATVEEVLALLERTVRDTVSAAGGTVDTSSHDEAEHAEEG